MVASAIAPASTASATYTVVIEGMTFNPPTLTIARGDRVTWVNEDLFVHTVTAASGTFDSHAIAPGTSWALTAKQSGEYPYLCTLHPTMAGRLVVR
jgi:plastocyanin